jgi:hypothetical protein
MRRPAIFVPMVNDKLWEHPAWQVSLDTLTSTGAVLLDVHTGKPGPAPVLSGTGGEAVSSFDPRWLTSKLQSLA